MTNIDERFIQNAQKMKPAPLLRGSPSVWLTPLFLTNKPELGFANPRPTPKYEPPLGHGPTFERGVDPFGVLEKSLIFILN